MEAPWGACRLIRLGPSWRMDVTPWTECAALDSTRLVLLLVDPDAETAEERRARLTVDGYDVHVTGCSAALAAVASVRPDLIVVHLHQGRQPCLEALEQLELRPDVRRCGLIAIDAGDAESARVLAGRIAPEHHALRTPANGPEPGTRSPMTTRAAVSVGPVPTAR